MQAKERQQQIARLLKEKGRMRVSDLIDEMQSPPATIRRDLIQMSERGELFRARGFVSNSDQRIAPGRIFSDGKLLVGRAAAALVADGSSVILDSGTTSLSVALQLVNKHRLRIVTNALSIANTFSNTDSEVMLTGGILDKERLNLIGPDTESFIKNVYADIAFVSITGFSAPDGLMSVTSIYGSIKRAILKSSNKTVLVAESGKFSMKQLFKFGDLSMIDTIVTDRPILNGEILDSIARNGVELIVADSAEDRD